MFKLFYIILLLDAHQLYYCNHCILDPLHQNRSSISAVLNGLFGLQDKALNTMSTDAAICLLCLDTYFQLLHRTSKTKNMWLLLRRHTGTFFRRPSLLDDAPTPSVACSRYGVGFRTIITPYHEECPSRFGGSLPFEQTQTSQRTPVHRHAH